MLLPVSALSTACLSLCPSVPRSCSGVILPGSPAILELGAPKPSSAGDFGGLPLEVMFVPLFQPVLSVHGVRTPRNPTSGLLKPLPIPRRPWSHIALDFVTGLPPSDGNTTILTVVDRFSKSVHLVPLPKIPSAKRTASLVMLHVFKYHGLPVDVVSDRGPQFTSHFWKAFCTLIGASVSLSSGYHPQKPLSHRIVLGTKQ